MAVARVGAFKQVSSIIYFVVPGREAQNVSGNVFKTLLLFTYSDVLRSYACYKLKPFYNYNNIIVFLNKSKCHFVQI